MVEVCERTKTKEQMLEQSINQYKEVFVKANREFHKVISVSKHHLWKVKASEVLIVN